MPPKKTQYIVTKLPNLVWDEYATYAQRELTVTVTKKKITLKAKTFFSATSRPLFKPDLIEIKNGRINSKYNVTFLEPLVIEKVDNTPPIKLSLSFNHFFLVVFGSCAQAPILNFSRSGLLSFLF